MNEEKFGTIEEFLEGKPATPGEQPTEPTEPTEPVESTDPAGTADPVEPVDPVDPADKDNPTDVTEEDDKGKKPKANNPMRELRDRANREQREKEKIDGAINRLSDGDYNFKLKDFRTEDGKVDYDALLEAMDAEDVAQRAAGKGIDPKLQAEIEKYEREKREVEIAKARVQMDRQLNNFQMENQMTQEDLNNFISDSMKMGVNPLTIASLDKTAKGTTALKMLHQAVYADKIIKLAVDEAVAKVRAEYDDKEIAAGGKPKANPAVPNKGKTEQTDPKGMALDEFLGTL